MEYSKINIISTGIDAGVIAGNGDTPLMMARRTSEQLYNAIRDFMERP